MIDPDINEQMARFAPSQNPADPGFDAIERAVAGMSGVPMPKADPVDIDIDRAVQDIAAQRRQDMASSLMAASEVNPDEAAQADALGRRFGVGQDIALRNMAEMRRQAMIQDTERMDLLRKDPVLARYIADREFAAQASDDVGVLSLLRPLVLEAAILQTPGGFFRVVGAGYERGQVVSERGDIGAKAMAGFAEQGDFDRAKELSTRMQQLGQQGLFGSAAEMIAQNVSQLRTIGTTAAGGAAIGSLAGPAGTVAGGALGAAAGVVIGTGTMEAGNLYLDMREQGVSDDAAIPAAIAGGFLNGLIEVVGMKIAAKPFKALASKVIREEVSKAIAQPTMRSALIAAGKAYGLQVGGEASEETLQEIVAIASEEIAKAADGIDSETSLREATGRIIEAFAYGGMASALLGGIGPGANLFVDLRRASNTERQQRFFEGLAANNKESRLAQRSPVAYERFLEAQAEGAQAETIYVDGRIAQQVLAQSGVPTAQLEEILPGIRERISEAVQTGGDVTIPTARFGARLANTELGNALLPHMRLSPDAMSATEAQEFATRRQDVVREAEQILAQKQEADATFVQQARQIEDTLASQIVATGQMDEKAARTSAQFMRDFYVTQAAALGMSPQQVYERFPVRVEGAMPAAAAPLEQASRLMYPSLAKAWDRYNSGERYMTVGDLADKIESLELAGKRIPQAVLDAVQDFRNAQREEREIYGERGGTDDDAGNALEIAVQNAAEELRETQPSADIMEQAAVPSAIDAQHREAIKAGDIATAQALTDAAAETRMPDSQVRDEAGKILRVFHGTQRIDRVGNRLLKKRATSGPMPFFTNTRPIAEGYAQGKQDTSIEDIGYEQWVKYTPKGQRSKVTLDQAWFYLTPEQKATATERIFTTGYENPDEGTGAIVGNTDTIASRDHVAYLLREARGNALTAAKELWLNSGSLFNEEQQFMDVLKGMGLTERFVYDSPHAVNSGIIEAYLNITNPLDTAAIPESVVEALQRRSNRSRRPAAQYGRDIWDKETRNPQEWMATLRSDIAEGKTQAWTSIPDWVTDVLRGLGYDGIKDMGGKFGGEQHTVWIPFEPEQVKFADAIAKDASGRLIPLSERFDLTSPMMYRQAAAGPARGGFDPKRLTTILNKTADLSTFLHESAHAFLTFYEQVAATPDAPARIVNDMDELLRWFKIDGATPAERIANWNGLTLDQKRKYHETFAYNFEVYLFEGKAPSVEMQGLFERFSAWLKRVYRSIRDDLNAIYRREFGEDLPILTGEVRQVMDRMLATDEQIKRQAAINEMKPQFQTQEQSGMDDAEWAAYQAMQQEAIEASITDMNKASMRQLQWLGNARSRILRDMQKKHDAKRKEVAAEMAAELRVEPVYRAMTYLRTGKFIDADGAEVEMEGPHRLDIKQVKAIYAGMPSEADVEPIRATGMAVPVTRPQFERLGYGKYGMLAEDGVAPDLVAETFGYSSGDQMIRALLAAKPIKEAVAERTDAEMLRRFGDMNTPEAREAEVQRALHNEARARFVAVELRHIARATEPVRVMVEAAKQVARELIAGTTVRDVRPADFIAAEARAARDASRMGTTINPVAVGQAAQTRAYNEAIEAGTDPAEAMAAAIEKGAETARKAQERSDALKAQYGADPQQALIRAKRAQLYQNQLAAEALRVREEVAKQVKYLRRILRDTNVKAMGAQAADQVAGLLERFEVAPVSLKRLDERKALAAWLAEQEAAGLVPDIAPEIVNEARRVNYREVKVSEFRDLVDAIRQIEHIGKRERKAAQEKLRAEFDALKDEAIQSMKDVAAKRGRKARKELGDEDRKWAQLIAGYDAMQQTIGSIVYVLDGGQRDGPLARMLLFTANDAGNQETTDRADATLALSKILDPIERKGQFSGRKLYFPQIDDSLSLEQRMVVALNYGNQSNIDRLLNGEKWTEEQVQPILESLTEEQLNAVQAIWNYLESFKPRVAAQERNLLGREPNWIKPRPFTVRSADGKIVNMAGGYYPAKYNPRRSSMSREMDESVEADRQMREAITAATTTRSYTKNRLDKPPEGGVLSRQMGGLYAGVNEVIHDLSWRTWAMDANRLLRDKEFQTVINSIYGRETYAAIKNWVDATVRGERGNYDVIENIAIGVRRNVSVSAMGLKFITAAIQVTGLIPATVRTGITPMVRAVAYFAANPRESSRIAREKSSFMRNRGRTRYRDLNEIANIVRGESRARRAYLANAYALIGLQQGMVDMSVWWAAYSNAIKEGKAEEMAVSIADQTVIDTQGSGMLKDLSQAMRGGQKQSAYAKLFTSFYQFSNTQYALLSAQLRTAPSMGKAAADAFTILVVGAFIEEMLRTLLKPSPDDEEPEDLAKALIANQIDFVIGLPFGGGELRGIGDMIVGEQAMQYRGPSGLRMVGEVRTFAGQTLQGEFDRAWTRSAINMSGLIWGIPSAQINDTIDGIEAVIEGEVEGVGAVVAPLTGVQR